MTNRLIVGKCIGVWDFKAQRRATGSALLPQEGRKKAPETMTKEYHFKSNYYYVNLLLVQLIFCYDLTCYPF